MDATEWDAFRHLVVERHRVAPLVADVAQSLGIPETAAVPIRAAAAEAAIEGLRQKAETLRIAGAMAAAGIETVLLKGWALAERLYGSAGARQGRDLDLLAGDGDFAAAAEVLETLGYRPVDPASQRTVGDPARALLKDVEFARPGQSFTVELHARSNAYRGWPGLSALEDGLGRTAIDRSGVEITVPTPRGDLVYLSIHGMQHVFSRLRWLHDIATLIEARTDADLARDLEAAAAIHGARFVRIAAGLAAAVFGSRWPATWRGPSPVERLAIRTILAAIADPDFAETGRQPAIRRIVLKLVAAGTAGQRLSLLRSVGEVLLGGSKPGGRAPP